METVMFVLGGGAILVAFELGAWFFGADSRNPGDSGRSYQDPEVGPGHRPTWLR
jgi:hypothetical protein